MTSVCMLSDVLSRKLLKAVEQSGEDIGEGEISVIYDRSCNFCRIAELSNSELDRISLKHITGFLEFHSALIDLGTNGHMLCSPLQFKTLYVVLLLEVAEGVKFEEILAFAEPATQTATVLEMETKALHFMRAQWMYSSDPREKPLQHMSVEECSIHLGGRGSLHLRCLDV